MCPFKALYSYRPEITINIKDDVIERKASTITKKRILVIRTKRKLLTYYLQ